LTELKIESIVCAKEVVIINDNKKEKIIFFIC